MTRPFFLLLLLSDIKRLGSYWYSHSNGVFYIYFVFISNSIRRMVFEILSIETSSASPVRHSLDVDPGQRSDQSKVVRLFRRIQTQSQSPAERPVPMGSEIVRLFRQRNFGYALAGTHPVRPELRRPEQRLPRIRLVSSSSPADVQSFHYLQAVRLFRNGRPDASRLDPQRQTIRRLRNGRTQNDQEIGRRFRVQRPSSFR